jgi:hypothetical protein
MTDLSIVDSVGNAGGAALDTMVGGASIALDGVTRPRRGAGRARRRGSDVNSSIAEATEGVVDEVTALPERVLIAYVRMLRRSARRGGVVGTVTRSVLDAVHGPVKDAAKFFERLERETTVQPVTRRARKATTRSRGSKATTRASVRGTARTAARRATSGAKRTAKTARGNAPRTATARGGRRRTA